MSRSAPERNAQKTHCQRPGGRTRWIVVLAALGIATAGCSPNEPDGEVMFVSPLDGDVVASLVRVEMAASDFVVEPAVNGVGQGRGHLHIMVDAPCVEARLTVPPDDQHLHFGAGQTTAEIDLEPGEHFLCLQAADGNHTALPLIDEITITVEEP